MLLYVLIKNPQKKKKKRKKKKKKRKKKKKKKKTSKVLVLRSTLQKPNVPPKNRFLKLASFG